MNTIFITQAKPNPLGKDRFGHLTPTVQLKGEWVDIRNYTFQGISLSNIELQHIAYTSSYPNGIWTEVFSIDWVLPAGNTLRIHSGGKIAIEQMAQVDRHGADYHAFTGKNYVWNNDKPDTPRLVDIRKQIVVDQATYTANPTEGKILVRKGDYLL